MRVPLTGLLLTFSVAAAIQPVHAQSTRPRLVVLLMVDQMRADYVEKFRHQWEHGLDRLLDEGARFTQADFPFANTATCAGHASVSTGVLPSVHGMVMNTWHDRDLGRVVACADDPPSLALSYGRPLSVSGQSAARLLAPTLADEMRAQLFPAARVAAFSLKARSAVTLGGQRPDAIAWVADEGAWVTSTAYPNAWSPEVARFVHDHPVEHQLWSLWERAAPDDAYLHEAAAVGARDTGGREFPHTIRSWSDWQASPLSDEYLADMALSVANDLAFGRDGRTDYLAVSFSALDLVGHAYGPHSHEVQDVLIRLDRTIGRLLDGLEALVGRDGLVVALTADHGVAPTPERAREFGLDAGRIAARTIPDAAQQAMTRILGPGRWTARLVNGDLYLDAGGYQRLSAAPGAMDGFRAALLAVPGVASVYSRDDLRAGSRDPIHDRLNAGYHPERSGDLFIVFKPYWFVGQDGATHGSPHAYDSRVPLILAGRGIQPGQFTRPVSPLDIAPTLASLAGITLPASHGRVLEEAFAPVLRSGASSSRRP